jgi:para-aminobenzoate synthetase/4-amino-4-deoxychorismate lyase
MTREPRVVLESHGTGSDSASWAFSGLVAEITAAAPADVVRALQRVEAAVAAGCHAAGFISYEAAPGLDPGLVTRPPGEFPLLWFGVFRDRQLVTPGMDDSETAREMYSVSGWQPSTDRSAYNIAIKRVREYIAAGHTYQVNFSLRQHFRFAGAPFAWYRDLCRAQQGRFCAYIDTGRFQLLSASPELFFRLDGDSLTVRPMKGTARRGRWAAEDGETRRRLRESPKEQAENLMIVDLLRNDLGRVAATGSVAVPALFDVETLPTVHQMTSTVTAKLREGISLVELFRALFPCGSVTGAPKKRTMEIIAELEDSPRGVYTGCVGFVSPGPAAVFSVAIRTAVIDATTGSGELGIGSGVTWDSAAAAEYDECRAKSAFAREPMPEFSLIESLLHEEGLGYFLLDRHLARLAASAAYFGFRLDPAGSRGRLEEFAAPLAGSHKVRLLLARTGEIVLDAAPVGPAATAPLSVALAMVSIDPADSFLYHKTTRRDRYTAELARHPGCGDVLFCNERGEVTEGTMHNVVARIAGELITPPLECGLLPGVLREELLARGEIRERAFTWAELARAEEIFLINSVRGWRRAKLA